MAVPNPAIVPAPKALLELAALHKDDFDAALQHIIKTDALTLGVERVNFWMLRKRPLSIVCELGYVASADSYERGQVLTATEYPNYFRALAEEQLIAAIDARTDPRTREFGRGYLVPLGIGSMMDAPVWLKSTLAGVLCHEHVGEARHWTPEEQEFALAIAQIIATTLEARERHRAEEAERRAVFVSDATGILTETLDPEEIPGRMAHFAVPMLADWCVLVGADGERFRALAAVHVEPSLQPVLEGAIGPMLSEARISSAVVAALRTGRSLLLPEITDEHLTRYCCDEPQQAVVRQLGARSAMIVPLLVRRQLLGVMLLASGDRVYAQPDLRLAEELGRRAAVALDNARLYRQAQETIKIRDDFISIASHELHSPLMAIQLAIDGIVRDPSNPDRMARGCQIASRQTRRLARLVDMLLDVSRIHGGRLQLNCEPHDLVAVVRDAVNNLEYELAQSECKLTVSEPGPIFGHWDRERLEQVITNLLSNAIKFGRGMPIEVSAAVTEDGAGFTVRDHGIGIPPDRLPFIFERFERGVSAREFGGLGLGLYIVRAIVDAHHGTVRVDSAPGQGATFTVELPRDSCA